MQDNTTTQANQLTNLDIPTLIYLSQKARIQNKSDLQLSKQPLSNIYH